MLFSDSVTAVTKIVLRSQWGWWGGVKKLFRWINSPSRCSTRIRDGVSVDLQGSYRRCISAFAVFAGKHEWTWHEQIGLSDLRGDLAASSGNFWSGDRATYCTVALGGVYFLVGDFMRILYSLLTPSPPAIASYTTSHIPTANAFFYRSLPSSPLATVSERSIRNAGLPVVPVVWPLLMGGEEASIADVWLFTLIWSMGSMRSSVLLANLSCQ